MRRARRTLLALGLVALASGAIGAQDLEAYRNSLTGEVLFGEWPEPTNGLQCRLGAKRTKFVGRRTPVLVLQVRNVSAKAIAINDLLHPNMLVSIAPSKKTYYDSDFQWIFDENRDALPAGATIEAACRVPSKLLPRSGEYTFSLSIRRGVYPTNARGIPLRPKGWWTGVMNTGPVTLERQ